MDLLADSSIFLRGNTQGCFFGFINSWLPSLKAGAEGRCIILNPAGTEAGSSFIPRLTRSSLPHVHRTNATLDSGSRSWTLAAAEDTAVYEDAPSLQSIHIICHNIAFTLLSLLMGEGTAKGTLQRVRMYRSTNSVAQTSA